MHFVSQLAVDILGQVGLEPFADLDAALAAARTVVGEQARILVLPYSDSVLPQEAA